MAHWWVKSDWMTIGFPVMSELPYTRDKVLTYRWRMPDVGSFGIGANLIEMGIGEEGRMLRRFVFDEPVSVKADQHLEVTRDGVMWVCQEDGRLYEVKGHWEKINEPMDSEAVPQ